MIYMCTHYLWRLFVCSNSSYYNSYILSILHYVSCVTNYILTSVLYSLLCIYYTYYENNSVAADSMSKLKIVINSVVCY